MTFTTNEQLGQVAISSPAKRSAYKRRIRCNFNVINNVVMFLPLRFRIYRHKDMDNDKFPLLRRIRNLQFRFRHEKQSLLDVLATIELKNAENA